MPRFSARVAVEKAVGGEDRGLDPEPGQGRFRQCLARGGFGRPDLGPFHDDGSFDRVDGRVPLRKAGHSLLTPLDDQTIPRVATDPQVRQQTLEGSNVNMVQEMAKLIHMVRGYEAYQRAILVSDNSLNMLIQRVGGGN